MSAALATGLAVLAVLLWVVAPGRRAGRRLADLDSAGSGESPAAIEHWGLRVCGALVILGLLIALGLLLGEKGPTLGSATLMVLGTVALLLRRRHRRIDRLANRTAVAQACSILAGQVRIGQVPTEALRSAAEDCPVLVLGQETVQLGGDPVDCWRAQAEEPGLGGLADLSRAWQLSVVTGAELATALEDVSEALAADRALDLVIAGEVAAPRATGKIMAVLPVVGIALGYLMGGDPLSFLLDTPLGWFCLALGSFFACVGVLWMEKVADRAAAVA